jgi:hypothetical protein
MNVKRHCKIDSTIGMNAPSTIANAIESIRVANDFALQQQNLPEHLRPFLIHAMPRLNATDSVAFIASDLWMGNEHAKLAAAVDMNCFHVDPQGRRIIGVVQAYGCGKTKTGLMLSNNFILLPIRFNVGSVGSGTLTDHVITEQAKLRERLGDSPTFQEVEAFSSTCLRLVHLCLFAMLALYDHCIEHNILDGSPRGRFFFALLLLNDQREVAQWCRNFFDLHKALAQNEAEFNEFAATILEPAVPRQARIVFLLDEVHVLFDKCRGFCLHRTNGPYGGDQLAGWISEQKDSRPSPGHRACTDLFYQFRLVMLGYLLHPGNPFGFVMCSTLFRVWKALEEENSPLSRGTIHQFFHLHWFDHATIKLTVRSLFNIPEPWLDALEYAVDGSLVPVHMRLSALGRPLFLMEFLERLCSTFNTTHLSDAEEPTLRLWLRKALAASVESTLNRAQQQISSLITVNTSADVWTSRQIVYLLYATQRLCGGTLHLAVGGDNEITLESIISKGVARLHDSATRFRISDAIFVEALRCEIGEDKNTAVLKVLNQNANLHAALVPSDSASKGFVAERLLAWLAMDGKLTLTVLDQQVDGSVSNWRVSCFADRAGTVPELELGSTSSAEPAVLAGIMGGTLNYVLLPTTLAGPDLWLRANIDGADCIVAAQSKVVDDVYTMANFTEALATLNPARMYKSEAGRTARGLWAEHLAHLETLPYHRIVFSACGFVDEVQFAVREYNRERGREPAVGQPRRFIHLLNLLDIQQAAGPLYDYFRARLTKATHEARPPDALLMAHDWRTMAITTRGKMLLPDLKVLCRYRGVTLNKRKREVLQVLDDHSTEAAVNERLLLLDPVFH